MGLAEIYLYKSQAQNSLFHIRYGLQQCFQMDSLQLLNMCNYIYLHQQESLNK
jgi:hypothetical protein